MSETPKTKDFWDKLDIILKPLGGLFAAITIAALGFITSDYLDKRQAEETRVRLYTELMSKREEAESALRKDMFATIIQSFLKPDSSGLDEKVLNLELLAYNFHESLNLKPLFTYLNKKIQSGDAARKGEYRSRLERVAREVSRRQLMVLEGAGRSTDRSIDLEQFAATPGGLLLAPVSLVVGGIERQFRIYVQKVDTTTRELKLRLEIDTPGDKDKEHKNTSAEFWIGFNDFPMIDNTRLPNDQRVAIVVNQFDEYSVDITLVYFPGQFASLKEKPYFQEVLNQLVDVKAKTGS